MKSRIAFALSALVAQPLLAQSTAPAPAPAQTVNVALDTDKGRIVLALDRGRAPVTTANFLRYVESGRLDGEGFYRAMPYGEGGLVQGGVTGNARKLLEPIEHEPVSQTGIRHSAGTISMANAGPGTARSDFFILTTDIAAFDKDFAAFGKVVEGMDVVRAILASPVSPTKGEGPMKGQMLDPLVKIRKARRVKP